jgi:cardiolipin synthase C
MKNPTLDPLLAALAALALCSASHAAPGPPVKASIAPIHSGPDAFAARQVLARDARRSLDLQYFIWEGDVTGSALLAGVLDAADRGVRVRMLLDDAPSSGLVAGLSKILLRHARTVGDTLGDSAATVGGIVGRRPKRDKKLLGLLKDIRAGGRDTVAAALDSHPNIEVRFFNPFRRRGLGSTLRSIEFLGDFWKLNRRMHNKAFIADGRVAITGGRNISDHYFGYDEHHNYRDLDLLVEGEGARAISRDFDAYWQSPQAVHVRSFWLDRPARKNLESLRGEIAKFLESHAERPPMADARRRMARLRKKMLPATARVVSDSPRKAGEPSRTVAETLGEVFDGTGGEMLIEHAFFIPTNREYPALQDALERGVTVRVLTNSVASNANLPAAVGYKRHRGRIVRLGADVRELKPDSRGVETAGRGAGSTGMHTKAVVFDGRKVFVGTFNMDPRSASVNTEIGLLVECPALARDIARRIEDGMEAGESWRVVTLRRGETPGGRLVWIDEETGKRMLNEPETPLLRRLKLTILSWLPLDPLL